MIYDLDLTVVLTAAGIAGLAAVYVWSKDPDRRSRAWRLLKLLLGRLLQVLSMVADEPGPRRALAAWHP